MNFKAQASFSGLNLAVAQAAFEQAGVPFGYIDGTMLMEWRRPVFERFREGKIKGIASVGCLSRGVDEDVHCIIDAQLTNSEMNLVQKIGRGHRNPHGNDKELLILDHAGNTINLGMVTDIYHDQLDSRKPSDKEPAYSGDNKPKKPHKCSQCHCLIPYGTAKCPVCGFVVVVKSKTQHEDGELIELTYGSPAKKKKEPKPDPFTKQEFYSGFLYIAQERGYKEGWAANAYREKFDVWPRGLDKIATPPTSAVQKWDQHRRIAFAKSKAAPKPTAETEAYAGEF